jgi:folate-dependent phosphoribosylglycinamide formyltransferase PurN
MKGEMRRHIRMTCNPPSLGIMNLHSSLLPNLSSLDLSSAESSFNRGGSKTHINKVHIVGCGMYHGPKCKLVCYLFMKLLSAFSSIL